MDISMFLANVGSLCLGMTLAIALFFTIAGRHSDAGGVEGCFMALLCVSGFSIALFFYVWAMKV